MPKHRKTATTSQREKATMKPSDGKAKAAPKPTGKGAPKMKLKRGDQGD